MKIHMENAEGLAPEQIRSFLQASEQIEFAGQTRREVYAWLKRTLERQDYFRQRKKQRGVIRAYLSKVSGLSQPQMTRLIRRYRETGDLLPRSGGRRRFPTKYTEADVALLAEVDRAHLQLSGPATRRILEREFREYGNKEFVRLAQISVSHIYNLRHSRQYRRRAAEFDHTKLAPVSIGERRPPDARGRPGYLQVDTVHQGDWDGAKGVYHLNAVDPVTQWEVVGCGSKISEHHLLPVLEAILHQFPFRLRGFHADNGSEFINHTVAKLLNKLLVEFTKSRAYKTTDNALVEGKNGAIIRRHIGYGHIPAEHAERIQKFYTAHFNPYLNFHRPCGFATVTVNARGKQKRLYKAGDYATPYEKLKSLPAAEQYLKDGVGFHQLDRIAQKMSDTDCARKMSRAKARLLRACKIESPVPPRF